MAKVLTYKLYIDGKWISSTSSKTFLSENPANPKDILGKFQFGSEKDTWKAITAAELALKSWSLTPPPTRGQYLYKIANLLREEKSRLSKIMSREMGKPFVESMADIQEAIDVFEYMAGEGRRLYGKTTTSELPNKFAMTIRSPLGVVGLITPWNFPIAIPAWKLSAALISGCTCVLKPSSDAPLSAIELVKIIEKAGIPKGVVNLVTGSGRIVGRTIVKSKRVRGISFTGHRDTGQWILANAGLKKVSLELGSKNAIIIMDDVPDYEAMMRGVMWGAFSNAGQKCTAASRIIIHKDLEKKFTSDFVKRAKKLKIGDPLNLKTELGPLINKKSLEKVHYYTEFGKKEGAKLLTGGKTYGTKGHFYEPTIFSNVNTGMRIANSEIFGPTTVIIRANNIDDAIKKANDVDYGLVCAVYTKDVNKAMKAITQIETGLVYINSNTTGSEVHLPFGGVKDTGNGAREGGIEGINEFTEVKTVYIDYSGELQRAQMETDSKTIKSKSKKKK